MVTSAFTCAANSFWVALVFLHKSILLLIPMVKSNEGEPPVGLCHDKLAILKLSCNLRMSTLQSTHISHMNWYPAGIMCVIQTEEPWCQFCQGVKIQDEVTYMQWLYVCQRKQFQFQVGIPIEELWTSCLLPWTPSVKALQRTHWEDGYVSMIFLSQ